MSTLDDLLKQQAAIAAAIEAERAKHREDAVAHVRELIKSYEITLSEVKNVLKMRKPRAKNGAPVSAKKASSTGRRGRPPKAK